MKKNEVKVGETYLAKVSDKVVPVRLDAENPRGGWDATNMATNKKVRIKSAQRLRGAATSKSKASAAKGETVGVEAPPSPEALTAAAHFDREAKKWFWTIRQDKQEHFDSPDSYDSEEKANADGEKWLKAYAKANDASRRKMLGWKPATLGDGSAAAPTTAKDDVANASAKKPARAPKAAKEAKPKKLSLIDAAAQVLASGGGGPLNVKQMVEQVVAQKLWTPGSGRTPSATLYSSILRELQHKGGEARFEKVDRGQFRLTDAGRQSMKGA